MNRKSLFNQLELAYNPISNYEFNYLKDDADVQNILKKSSLYAIAQRPILSFENIIPNDAEEFIQFEIHQQNNPAIIYCKLPFYQKNIIQNIKSDVLLEFGTIFPNNKIEKTPPINHVHAIKIFESNLNPDNFRIWFSPEKLLHNFWKGQICAELQGNIKEMLKYRVHYVGKATDQYIWKRLTGHETLQHILSVEYPITFSSLPTHEIALLFFSFYDNLSIGSFDVNSNVEDMVKSIEGKDRPDKRTIFLDAEKALIKAMQPKHNTKLFNNYPKSSDGLQKYNYNNFSYTFMDPIILQYELGEIEGGIEILGGDMIIITDNKKMQLFKHPQK